MAGSGSSGSSGAGSSSGTASASGKGGVSYGKGGAGGRGYQGKSSSYGAYKGGMPLGQYLGGKKGQSLANMYFSPKGSYGMKPLGDYSAKGQMGGQKKGYDPNKMQPPNQGVCMMCGAPAPRGVSMCPRCMVGMN